MAVFTSNQVFNIIPGMGIAAPGLLGSQLFPRATEIRGLLKIYHFNIEADNPHPMPGTSGEFVSAGNDIIIALLKPTDRIYAGFYTIAEAWDGTTPVLTFGKIDPNNSSNTDASHYVESTTMANTIDWFEGLATKLGVFYLNLCEQVGADPQGDQSVGNQLPDFGSADIQITCTIGSVSGDFGDPPVGTLEGYIIVVEEGN